jgi:hypothetical protein
MEKMSWTDCVRNEGVLQRVKEREISYIEYTERRVTGLVTAGVGTAF